jgi:hypothetical protein
LAEYLHEKKEQIPELIWTMSLAGIKCPGKSIVLAKQQGFINGAPDYMIYAARRAYHGLAVELKRVNGNHPTEAQEQFLNKLTWNGYLAVVAYGARAAIDTIEWYLNGV